MVEFYLEKLISCWCCRTIYFWIQVDFVDFLVTTIYSIHSNITGYKYDPEIDKLVLVIWPNYKYDPEIDKLVVVIWPNYEYDKLVVDIWPNYEYDLEIDKLVVTFDLIMSMTQK